MCVCVYFVCECVSQLLDVNMYVIPLVILEPGILTATVNTGSHIPSGMLNYEISV